MFGSSGPLDNNKGELFLKNVNSSFNQYAVAFNDEFIDVSVGSTEKADISYKGRDNNSKLIVT